jgi:hypothetical protein
VPDAGGGWLGRTNQAGGGQRSRRDC